MDIASVTWKNRFRVLLVLEVARVSRNLKRNSLRVSLFRDLNVYIISCLGGGFPPKDT